MLECSYVIVIQFIIETSKRVFKKMREKIVDPRPWGMGPPYNDLYEEASPERGIIFTLQVYERVGISRAGVYVRVGKSVT